MKCSVCGKEFGEGSNCQSCGIDRVTGLGSYIGYNVPKINHSENNTTVYERELPKSPKQIVAPEKEPIKVKTMICYNCTAIIPDNSKFCPKCGQELYTTCPKCGNIFSSEYPICNQCGTNIQKYLESANCQNCGIDRVTGLGNSSDYDSPASGGNSHSSKTNQDVSFSNGVLSSPNTIVCYACGEIIPGNSKFCPYCSIELYVKCPKCGQTYSSQYPACNQCGTNRQKYLELKSGKYLDKIFDSFGND